METGHTADDGGIVRIAAITVNLAPVGEDALDVIEQIGALGMPRQFGFFPGFGVRGSHVCA